MKSGDPSELPPMLRLYKEYKERFPDSLLLFQVGDFYEVFFEDAKVVARALNLTLTSRDKSRPDPIPMCGVPVAVIDTYLDRLVEQGHSVAVVSQSGESEGRKGMMERGLERIVTPGIRVLGAGEGNTGSIAAISLIDEHNASLAWAFPESGTIWVRENISRALLAAEIGRLFASEVVLPSIWREQQIDRRLRWVREIDQALRGKGTLRFRSPGGVHEVAQSARDFKEIRGYSSLTPGAKGAIRILLSYIDEVTVERGLGFREIRTDSESSRLRIDSSTVHHLELVANNRDGSTAGSLYGTINQCVTAGGRRTLRQWILSPLIDPDLISERYDVVEVLMTHPDTRESIRKLLHEVPDLERIASRIELAAANPAELAALRDGLRALTSVLNVVEGSRPTLSALRVSPVKLFALASELQIPEELSRMLSETLEDEPPISLRAGGAIRSDFSVEIGRLRSLKANGAKWMAEFESSERQRCGINSLKVKYNQVLGYFIEVTKVNAAKVPSDYIPKQSTANSERFFTPELKEREKDITTADSRLLAEEKRLFEELRERCKPFCSTLRELGQIAAQIDILASFGDYAEREGLSRPEIVEEPLLQVVDGKHPVLAAIMRRDFVPNSLTLSSEVGEVAILTGPNMGGKSTFLRQTAQLVVLAQIGSFVPAGRFMLGPVDQLLSRIGANDNLLEGESTFMVEMRETAQVLQHATSQSLLIIDEIGRGTSTEDGKAIAQAVLEWIVEQDSPRTVFATHFHHLTDLAARFECIQNISVGSVDRGGEVYFTHEIKTGPANRSYGLDVARLAGLPKKVVRRAEQLVEAEQRSAGSGKQLTFFSSVAAPAEPGPSNAAMEDSNEYKRLCIIRDRVGGIDPDQITPLQALQLISELKQEADRE